MDIIQRASPRFIPASSLRVYEQSLFMGYLIDISENGIMILSDAPVEEGRKYQLTVTISKDGAHHKKRDQIKDLPIQFSGQCRWVRQDEADKNCYLSGFQVTDISEDQRRSVDALIRQNQME